MGWVILQSIINKVLEETLLLWKIALSLKHPKQNVIVVAALAALLLAGGIEIITSCLFSGGSERNAY